ncbi:hypothetical protein Aperf_G00000128417 [Anoplocephala perfoliata]
MIAVSSNNLNLAENVAASGEADVSDIDYPVYRFLFHQTNAYLSQSSTSCEIVAQEQNPFSSEIEWQWIPHIRYNGALLRNLRTRNFLCFDNEGKPVAVKQANLERCLLQALLPKFAIFKRANDIQIDEEEFFYEDQFEPLSTTFSVHQSENANFGTLRPKDNGVKFAIPTAIHLKSLFDDRSWYVGFCAVECIGDLPTDSSALLGPGMYAELSDYQQTSDLPGRLHVYHSL